MNNKSIWEEINRKEINKTIPSSLTTDVLIIGGGITGLTTAYFLKDTGKKITIIDKSLVGMGVTCKTTAKITYLQGDIYQILEKHFNKKIAKNYLNSQKEAIAIIKTIVEKNNIDCDFEQVDSIAFTTEEKNISKIKKEKELLENWGIKVSDVRDKNIKAGIKVSDTYIFHPLKYLKGLQNIIKDKVDIYENVLANEITLKDNSFEVTTTKGIIKADKVVVACHYPFFLLPTLIPLKTYIKREYVNASKINQSSKYTAINIDKDLQSIRFYQDCLIYGSNQHRLTSKIDYKKNYEKSRSDFKSYFKEQPEYTWMNQDVMSHDNLPFIGEVRDNLYIGTAYNAWGMTNGTLAAKIITDKINNKTNIYQSLFDPKRRNITIVAGSFLGAFHYLKVYAQALFQKNNPYYVEIKGNHYGVYVDEENKKHIVKLICPHMKCRLVFNREEQTWDCPCHGSRFDLDGNVIEGPATEPVTKKDE